MIMTKKIIPVALALMLTFSLAASSCGGGGTPDDGDEVNTLCVL